MQIKGAIFDMDGTLVDSLMFWDHLWKEIGIRYMNDEAFRPCEEVNKKVRTMIYTDAMTYFKEYYKIPGSTAEFFSFADHGTEDFYRYTVKVKAGAIELLEYLKSQNIRMCLASATNMKEIKIGLESCKLKPYFDSVLSCVDIGVGKDRPDIYLQAMHILQLPAEEICVFEDSYVALETAKAVGFQTVGVFDQYNFEQTRLKNASDIYLNAGQTLNELILQINR